MDKKLSPPKSRPSLILKTLSRALDLFEAFSFRDDELGITELSKRLGLHKNNIFRLLATLQARGYIEQNQFTGDYRFGPQVFLLGQLYVHQLGILTKALPVMEEITRICNETSVIAIRRGWQVLFLDAVKSSRMVRVTSRIGQAFPLYATAFGKVLLSPLTEEEASDLLKVGHQPPPVHRAPPTPGELMAEVEACRKRGYALTEGELEDGVTELAAPILDYSHRTVAALGIMGPAPRFTPELIREKLLPLLLDGVHRISLLLGYSG